jgi:hypothetical protein
MNIITIVAALLLAQASAAPSKVDPNEPLTMNGCVARDAAKDSGFTFTDNASGSRFRLTGKSLAKYSGQSVEVVGIVDNKRLRVAGGLWPSPNVAAQAGAIDPGKAAVAALGGGTTGSGNVELPTLKITRVGLGQGECRR